MGGLRVGQEGFPTRGGFRGLPPPAALLLLAVARRSPQGSSGLRHSDHPPGPPGRRLRNGRTQPLRYPGGRATSTPSQGGPFSACRGVPFQVAVDTPSRFRPTARVGAPERRSPHPHKRQGPRDSRHAFRHKLTGWHCSKTWAGESDRSLVSEGVYALALAVEFDHVLIASTKRSKGSRGQPPDANLARILANCSARWRMLAHRSITCTWPLGIKVTLDRVTSTPRFTATRNSA